LEPKAESIWILGYGQFGSHAAKLFLEKGKPQPTITVVDSEPKENVAFGIDYIQADGIQWFIDNFHQNSTVGRIIPALPVHLAAEWLKGRLILTEKTVSSYPIPEDIIPHLPHPYRLSDACYAISHADFLCPPDCDEPEETCTVTGKPRPTPLYELVGELANKIALEKIAIHTIESRQFAAGVGGFSPADLWQLFESVKQSGQSIFLVCTACKCHGIITGFTVF